VTTLADEMLQKIIKALIIKGDILPTAKNRKLIRVQRVLDREFLSLRNTDGTLSIIHVSNTVSMDVKSSKLNAPGYNFGRSCY
jgi:hypothetical protein